MSNKRYFRKQFARYDGNGRIIPGSNIWANKAPKHGNCMSNKRYFRKQFARYDGNGRIIPGSNIWANKAPKHGNWVEVQAYECCNSPVCVTYNALISRGTATIAYTDCDGQMQQIECGPGVTPFCALRGSYSYDALNVLVVEAGEGCLTTTTTTLEPSTAN